MASQGLGLPGRAWCGDWAINGPDSINEEGSHGTRTSPWRSVQPQPLKQSNHGAIAGRSLSVDGCIT
ncbi:hypothetical protein FPR49_12100 [Salmonella enterica]|nr:hypothetical protein [Salmonella enterica]ECH4299124.1 hypothetical protein [Salmonella enterica]EJP5181305.1 hypothetical protein [Salmonella enterica]